MPWGSTELEIRRPVSGADKVPMRSVTDPALANDTPPSGQPRIALRATIHQTAEAGCQAGSTAVN
jgi:hypothetical protein